MLHFRFASTARSGPECSVNKGGPEFQKDLAEPFSQLTQPPGSQRNSQTGAHDASVPSSLLCRGTSPAEDLGIFQANAPPLCTASGIQTRAPPPSPFAPCIVVFGVTPVITLPLPFLSGPQNTTEVFWALRSPSHDVLPLWVSLCHQDGL